MKTNSFDFKIYFDIIHTMIWAFDISIRTAIFFFSKNEIVTPFHSFLPGLTWNLMMVECSLTLFNIEVLKSTLYTVHEHHIYYVHNRYQNGSSLKKTFLLIIPIIKQTRFKLSVYISNHRKNSFQLISIHQRSLARPKSKL